MEVREDLGARDWTARARDRAWLGLVSGHGTPTAGMRMHPYRSGSRGVRSCGWSQGRQAGMRPVTPRGVGERLRADVAPQRHPPARQGCVCGGRMRASSAALGVVGTTFHVNHARIRELMRMVADAPAGGNGIVARSRLDLGSGVARCSKGTRPRVGTIHLAGFRLSVVDMRSGMAGVVEMSAEGDASRSGNPRLPFITCVGVRCRGWGSWIDLPRRSREPLWFLNCRTR